MTLTDVLIEAGKAETQADRDYAWEKYEEYLAYHEQDWKEQYYAEKYKEER